MVLSIILNYFFGLIVSYYPRTKTGRLIVFFACIYNLGQLFIFKYLSWLLHDFGIFLHSDKLIHFSSLTRFVLPIGISFYTFQAMSYVIDVYRGKSKVQRNILDVGLYIAFFPQLIAGPIVRYETIAEQLKSRVHSLEKFSYGVKRFVIGLSKKLIMANQLAVLADLAFNAKPDERSVLLAWAGILAFTLQVYFDFSGYSDMAIGLGRMFGFEFLENFNYPYISRSVTEYWRRWHISLGEWFRDYLYYPLAMGPAVSIRKFFAPKIGRDKSAIIASIFVMFVVWMATGIWHGADWTFVLWGFTQFAFIIYEQYRKPFGNKTLELFTNYFTTALCVMGTKVLFKSVSISQAFMFYGSMFGLTGNVLYDEAGLYWAGQFKILLVLGCVLAVPSLRVLKKFLRAHVSEYFTGILESIFLCALLVADVCFAIGGSYNPFIYFNF